MAKNSDTRGMNKKGQTVTFKGQKINFPAQSNVKPTEAITAKGQKATGLAKSDNANRFKPELSKNIPTSQKAVDALNAAGRFAAESVVLGAAGKAISTAAKSSYTLGKTVVHGSPVKGLKTIVPKTGSAARPAEKVAYGWNPKAFGDKKLIENYASEYAKGGSVYVGKVPRGSIVKDANKGVVVSKAPIKVKKEIPVSSGNVGNKIDKAIRGSSVRGVKQSIQNKKRVNAIQRSSRNSPV